MDYLQYSMVTIRRSSIYWWVLNLIINGLPSIQYRKKGIAKALVDSFKPYYKWITFNTSSTFDAGNNVVVLNLIINGLPSILYVIN